MEQNELEQKVADMENKLNQFLYPDRYEFPRNVRFRGQKIGFNNALPVVQSPAIPPAAGGANVDPEARAALNTLLAYLKLRGDTK